MKIEAENLSWAAGPAIIVDDIDVPAMPGRVLGLLGPNESGKSTLLEVLARIIQPYTDAVRLDNRPYGDWTPRDITQVLSVVQQKIATDQDVAIRGVIDLGRIPHCRRWADPSPRDRRAVGAATRRIGIGHPPNRGWHTLSRGEQQRTHPVRASAQEGQVMLLDEPTSRLDISHQLDVLETLRKTGLGVVVALHDPNPATTSRDEVLVLHEGRAVYLGRPADVLTKDLIREIYGVEVRILHPNGNETPLFQFLRPVTQT